MKKLICAVLALTLIVGASAALAEPKKIDGISDRKIKIHKAGLNPSADEMIEQMISPTTGRRLDEIMPQDGFAGVAVTGTYQPIMVQISNSGNGVGYSEKGEVYAVAPVNASYADVVYEACQYRGGGQTRMTMIFSDLIPDFVGFVRSTRLTHVRIRQEWECAFCTSGYTNADVPAEWSKMKVKSPSGKRTEKDPGIVYVGDFPKVWKQYVKRLSGIKDANTELFMTADIVNYIVPKDHKPANHTWKFTDDVPAGGDKAQIVYVTFGSESETDSRLEYDPEQNAYIRYVHTAKDGDLPYRDSRLVNPEMKKVRDSNGMTVEKVDGSSRVLGDIITFSNVIVQSIKIKWKTGLRPDPVLTGKGNADYFMGGKHYAGVWERKDYNSRTVFYGEDGNEIELQRGRTLIILLDYNEKIHGGKDKANVKYE